MAVIPCSRREPGLENVFSFRKKKISSFRKTKMNGGKITDFVSINNSKNPELILVKEKSSPSSSSSMARDKT